MIYHAHPGNLNFLFSWKSTHMQKIKVIYSLVLVNEPAISIFDMKMGNNSGEKVQ